MLKEGLDKIRFRQESGFFNCISHFYGTDSVLKYEREGREQNRHGPCLQILKKFYQ